MADPVNIRPGPVPGQPLRPAGPAAPAGGAGRTEGKGARSFAQVLGEKLAAGPLQFSRHAQERLREAGRQLTTEQVRALEEAVDRAAAKGAKESLVLMDDLALVVSVKNRTVITAVAGERMKEQVFTGIDSAILAGRTAPQPVMPGRTGWTS